VGQINKQDATRIAAKLLAKQLSSGGAHTVMGVFYKDVLIAQFGIRHGSNKDQGHGHVPRSIYVSPNYAKQLAVCTKSNQQWIELMKDKGHISDDGDSGNK
jgi:hypothetical protein